MFPNAQGSRNVEVSTATVRQLPILLPPRRSSPKEMLGGLAAGPIPHSLLRYLVTVPASRKESKQSAWIGNH